MSVMWLPRFVTLVKKDAIFGVDVPVDYSPGLVDVEAFPELKAFCVERQGGERWLSPS